MQTETLQRTIHAETEIIRIGGLKNEACVNTLNNALSGIEGVHEASTSLVSEKATVSYAPETISKEILRDAVKAAGYEALPPVHGEDGVCCGGCGG